MNSWHIHIKGQVQGVGFRPYIYRLAMEFDVKGWVSNARDGVHIRLAASDKIAERFYESVIRNVPPLGVITDSDMRLVDHEDFDDFHIKGSDDATLSRLLITPDAAICHRCRTEINDRADKRLKYPFTTCNDCGPRYSIIQHLPYDRGHTTMSPYALCPECANEYHQPADRRYHSQTISCHQCGVRQYLYSAAGKSIDVDQGQMVNEVTKLWADGQIVAIKGIGGYLLTCDAKNEMVVERLRKRKQRPSKPLAVMIPPSEIEEYDVKTKRVWQSSLSPIVLVPMKRSEMKKLVCPAVAPGLDKLGIMIPYTPLYDLLMKEYARPIVATSANISNAPIVYRDEQAIEQLKGLTDFVLINDRKIVVPQDDSVIAFSPFYKNRIVLRRSRGLAPTYINSHLRLTGQKIFAAGADLKSAFAFLQSGNVYLSQYFGDLQHYETCLSYREVVRHFLDLFSSELDVVLCDKHEGYSSTQIGAEVAVEMKVPLFRIQHHKSHFAAVLGENNLLDTHQSVLGVIWDGIGYGDDGEMWGGEFFRYGDYAMERCVHFQYFPYIAGDKMSREPRISALAAMGITPTAERSLSSKFSKTEWDVYSKLISSKHNPGTSSVGRLFDAVASLLGIMDVQTFEGEAAMRLEQLATRYFAHRGLHMESVYFDKFINGQQVSIRPLINGILEDIRSDKSIEFIAAKFHYSLVVLIETIAQREEINQIAFSGGVFQNGLLVDLILENLSQYKLYFHRHLSSNDENISFGQLVYHHILNQKEKLNKPKQRELCV